MKSMGAALFGVVMVISGCSIRRVQFGDGLGHVSGSKCSRPYVLHQRENPSARPICRSFYPGSRILNHFLVSKFLVGQTNYNREE